jgi:4-hydroxybenzoate polyprenyltransferase
MLAWVILAFTCARFTGMGFNRIVDREIDARNPRTAMREIPSGAMTVREATVSVAVASAVFVYSAWSLNPLCAWLSPVALAWVCFYSYTKRFTRWSHLVLGLAMGIGPTAAWIAVRGTLDPRILILTGVVLFWGAGFDVLYSCQDHEFDCEYGLHSVPRFFGIRNALLISTLFHVIMLALLAWAIVAFGLGAWAIVGALAVAVLLAYEHSIVKPNDLSRLNAAFFTMNGFVSVAFFVFVAADVLTRR